MRKILYCWVMILLVFPLSANATLSDDVKLFEQKYAEIYENIDPALAIKMEIFLQDVVDYVVIHYTAGKDINVQIKNGVGSVLLTGDKYKNDLLPFMLEQSENTELYQSQLSEMQSIVRKEVQLRLNLYNPPAMSDIPDNSLILGQDIFDLTTTTNYNFACSLAAAATGSNIYYKFNGHWLNLSDGSVAKFSDYFDPAKYIDSSYSSWTLRRWYKTDNTVENFILTP